MTETTGSTPPASKTKNPIGVILVVLFAIGLAWVMFFNGGDSDDVPAVATEETETRLESAQAQVDWPASKHVQVRDDGYTLIIDGKGEDSSGADLGSIVVVLITLDTPDSVTSRMDNTRALDGMQEATWDNLTATWTYHPDNGLDIIIEDSAR